jgi:multiple sugar transport system substrate-binding protein
MQSKRLTRRGFLNLTATVATGALAAACVSVTPATTEEESAAAPAAAQKANLLFWSDLVGSKEEGRTYLLDQFNQQSETTVVEHEGIFGQDEAHQKFLTALSGGVVPDLYGNGADLIPGYVEIGALTDLGPYLDKSESISAEDFPEGVLSLTTYDGKIWGIPVYADTLVMYYNKDLMAKAGLDPENPPQDWDSMREAAIAMTERDDDGTLQVAGMLVDGYSAPRLFLAGLYAYGGQLLSEDGSRAAFNSPEGKEVLTFLVNLLHEDNVTDLGWGNEFEDSINEPFIAGKAGMFFDVPAATRRIVRWAPEFENWGIGGLPAGPEGQVQIAEADVLMIPERADDKDAAWELIEYWMKPDVMVRWAQDVFRPPSTWAALQDEALMSDPRIAPVSAALEHTVDLPQTTHWAEIFNTLTAEIQLALVNDKTPEQALDDAAATVDRLLTLE